MGDKVKGSSPKKLKILIEVPELGQVKAHVYSLNIIHLESPKSFVDRVIHLEETWADQVNGRTPKKLKSIIEAPNVVDVKVHVLGFNMILT